MSERPRIPTPAMIAAAWDVIDQQKRAAGISRLGPGLGVREIWEAMWDATEIARLSEKGEG